MGRGAVPAVGPLGIPTTGKRDKAALGGAGDPPRQGDVGRLWTCVRPGAGPALTDFRVPGCWASLIDTSGKAPGGLDCFVPRGLSRVADRSGLRFLTGPIVHFP